MPHASLRPTGITTRPTSSASPKASSITGISRSRVAAICRRTSAASTPITTARQRPAPSTLDTSA
jgi:hypothetical protein